MFRACPCGGRIESSKPCDRCGRKTGQDTRPKTAQRGYDSKWNRFSQDYRKKHPFCVCCLAQGIVNAERGRTGTRVDHIVPLRLAPEWKYTLSNLQTLCEPCDMRHKQPLEERCGRDTIAKEWRELLATLAGGQRTIWSTNDQGAGAHETTNRPS